MKDDDTRASYVDRNAWQVARIKDSLEEAKTGAPGASHAEVEQWVKSWNTKKEIPLQNVKHF